MTASLSPDGGRTLTADARGRIRIWPVDPMAVRPHQVVEQNDVR